MGNCQATDAAAAVVQFPGGKTEKLYWPTPASDVMRSHPGFHVALITHASEASRFTRVRLLRPRDTLLLGHVYRLVTSAEVAKGLRARKLEKMRAQMDVGKKQPSDIQARGIPAVDLPAGKEEDRSRVRAAPPRPRQWRPSLQSIAEIGGSG
ncbi:uncharacterized protein LOC144712617 [Wolffia australiana]